MPRLDGRIVDWEPWDEVDSQEEAGGNPENEDDLEEEDNNWVPRAERDALAARMKELEAALGGKHE